MYLDFRSNKGSKVLAVEMSLISTIPLVKCEIVSFFKWGSMYLDFRSNKGSKVLAVEIFTFCIEINCFLIILCGNYLVGSKALAV